MEKPIIVIAGPTASGKTALAIELAKEFNGEVINADSRSIYTGMDIGTGKPTREEMSGIPHHLFDIAKPDKTVSLSGYKKLAQESVIDIHNRNKIPFIVGGTGLYIDAVVYDFSLTEAETDPTLRKNLESYGASELADRLKQIDKKSWENIDRNNKRRLIRAIEVVTLTKKSFVEQKQRRRLPKNVLYLAININRDNLYQKINQRVSVWEKLDFENEVKLLLKKYSASLPSMSGIGYKQFALYLDGQISKEDAIKKFQQGDRNLAKRQLTWFRKNKDIHWIKNFGEAKNIVSAFLK